MYPEYCHTVTKTKEKNAFIGSESHELSNNGIDVSSPNAINPFEKTNCQMNPSTIPPIKLGVKKPALKKFCPLKPLVRKYANKNAIICTITVLNATYPNVNNNADQKFLSANASR